MDWKRIKAEYIAGGTSYRKLAEKYGVSRSKLQAVATREKWVDLKSQTQAKTESKLVESISDKESKKATDIVDVADKLLEKISTLIDTVKDTQGIKHISSALKDIKDITLRVDNSGNIEFKNPVSILLIVIIAAVVALVLGAAVIAVIIIRKRKSGVKL